MRTMRKIKLFLASAQALDLARRDFEVMVGRRNQRWIDEGLFIDLVIWEDFQVEEQTFIDPALVAPVDHDLEAAAGFG